MKLPRDLSSAELIKSLRKIGYAPTRQKGSHIRLTTDSPTQHHITRPNHHPLRVGMLAAILNEIATHRTLTRDELIILLFG
ncbi:MAG: type II toxin-antitoxin system HicA family toxin [Cyclobacteriaceae bacterium]